MKVFTVYDPATGDILRSGAVANDSDVERQARDGEAMLHGVRGDYMQQVVNIETKRLNKRPAAEAARLRQEQFRRRGVVSD